MNTSPVSAASAPRPPQGAHSQRRGSALLVVIMLTAISGLLIASVLDWGVTEQTLNEHHILTLDARNAAESVVEQGVWQLLTRWDTQTSFTDTELAPGNNPLTISTSFENHFGGTNVQVNSFQLIGGLVPEDTVRYYVDPDDPANEGDVHLGKRIFVRQVNVYGTATAERAGMDPVEVYAMNTFELRDAPLFSHAVFYNMDLEFHPGPAMAMNGPVHANGDIYMAAVNDLKFHDVVSTPQQVFVGMKNAPDDWSSFNSSQKGDTVFIADSGGTWHNFYKGSGSKTVADSYWDSRSELDDFSGTGFENWREFSSNRWDGNLQSEVHETPSLNPVGYKDYVADDPDTSEVGDDLNHGYAIIEPNLSVSSPNHKADGESSKFSYKAGLNIRIHESDPGLSHAVELHDDAGTPAGRWVTFSKIQRESPPSGVPTSKMPPEKLESNSAEIELTDESGSPYTVKIYEVEEIPVTIEEAAAREILKVHNYSEDGDGKPDGGFYDKRRNKGVSLVEMDVQAFRRVVDDTYDADGDGASDYDPSLWQGGSYNPEDDYNGVVYVEFPADKTGAAGGRADNIVTSTDTDGGLWLTNGDQVPDPDYNYDHGNNKPRTNRDRGFTLATNNTMYVQGHFNADGNMSTGSNSAPDSSSAPNPPVALAADSITLLSDAWDPAFSKGSKNDRDAVDTEFNAAILTGLTPSMKGGDTSVQSGGNHNFPRFLENWGGETLRYRGSMVALFESELASEGISTSYYSPPQRDWGFYEEFGKGNYPPGTPNVRSFRKLDFRILTRAQWEDELNALPAEWDSVKPTS
jgi:hypothetical protein